MLYAGVLRLKERGNGSFLSKDAPAAFLESRARLVGHLPPSAIFCRPASVRTRPSKVITSNYRNLESRVGPSIVRCRQGLPAGPALDASVNTRAATRTGSPRPE